MSGFGLSEGVAWFNSFSSNQYVQGGQEFLQSNSIVAKFAFLILALILFMTVLRVGTTFMSYLFAPSANPILLNGMLNSRQMLQIPQNPSLKGSVPIVRSKDRDYGLEFTWSVWIFVDDYVYKEHDYKHIFHKGNDNIKVSGTAPYGLNSPNNGPGLYLTPDTNNLLVLMNTYNKIQEYVTVPNIPLNKWVHIVVRVSKQTQLDVYINGSMAKRHMLSSVPRQNYGDVFVSMNGGFSGYTSDLRYFSEAIGTSRIQALLDGGPNTKFVEGSNNSMEGSLPQYLSNRWYYNNANDV